MNKVLLFAIIIAAATTMVRRGVGATFAYVFLPVVLLVSFVKAQPMPGVPNITSNVAVLYGVVIGLAFRWQELRKIRWNLIDTVMVLMLLPVLITTTMTNDIKLGEHEMMEFACRWLFPYFFARVALQDADGRRAALKVLCVLTIVVGCLTALESSGLRPNVTARVLASLNWDTTASGGVLKRFGLARAIATGGQPIDLGNMGLLAGVMILILIPATGQKWTQKLNFAGILGAGAMVFGCVSLTPWIAMVLCFLIYFALSRPGLGKWLVVPILLAEIAAMAGISNKMLNETISPDRPDDAIEASRWIRVRIIQDAWDQASTAGVFGYGSDLDTSHIAVGSVDNSYLLFLMQTGWFSLGLWFLLLMVTAVKGAVALGRAATPSERLPVAAALAGLLAIVVAMYTVFFGFAYAILFVVVLGMLSTMTQMLAGRGAPAGGAAAGYGAAGGAYPPAYGMVAGGYR